LANRRAIVAADIAARGEGGDKTEPFGGYKQSSNGRDICAELKAM